MAARINRLVAIGVFRNHRVAIAVTRKRQIVAHRKTAFFSVATKILLFDQFALRWVEIVG